MQSMMEQVETSASKVFLQVLESENDYVIEANLTIEIVFTPQYQPQVLAIRHYIGSGCSWGTNWDPTIFAGRLQLEDAQAFLGDIFTVISEPQVLAGKRYPTETFDDVIVIWQNYTVPELGDSGRLHFRGRNIPQKLAERFLGDVKEEQTEDSRKQITRELCRIPAAISGIAYEFKHKLYEISHSMKQHAQ
jgi:hypothetical protein